MTIGFRFALLSAAALLATGCAMSADDAGAPEQVSTASEGISAKLGNLSVHLDDGVYPVQREGRTVWTVRGSTNRDVTNLMTFVPDDQYAMVTELSPRSFEITFETRELQTVLEGRPLFLRLVPVDGSPATFASISVSPRFTGFYGSSQVYVDANTTPIFWGGQVEYRGHAHLGFHANTFDFWANNGVEPSLTKLDPRNWQFDFDNTSMVGAANPSSNNLHFVAINSHGTSYTKYAYARMRVTELELTTQDPYVVWPAPVCTAELQACLDALPFGTYDASSCGSFDNVRTCRITKVLPIVDDASTTEEIANLVDAANAQLPPEQRVASSGYTYRWASQMPTSAQITWGLINHEKLAGGQDDGPIAEDELIQELTPYHMEGFVAAARHFAYYNTPELSIIRILPGRPVGTGLPNGNATLFAILYPLTQQVLTVEVASVN